MCQRPEDKLIHDLEYIADRSIRLYLRVLGATIVRIMRLTSAAGTDNA
jgi:hypothetical protein